MVRKSHSLRCKCGAVQGQVQIRGVSSRIVCYCKDCQAFARYLGRTEDVLDRHGGTDIVQVSPSRVSFVRGRDQIAAIRLTDQGMIRWFAKCCNTPIGNTPPNYKLSFVGLIHSCLGENLESSFGAVKAHANATSANGDPRPTDRGLLGAVLRFIGIVGSGRLTGQYKHTPFFSASGTPIVEPLVLKTEKLK